MKKRVVLLFKSKASVFLLTALLVGLIVYVNTQPALAAVSGDYTYTVSGVNATITAYSGAGGDVVIPGELDGYTVVGIGANVFQNKATLTAVVIPDTVTSLGSNAFYNCTNLTSITMSVFENSVGEKV
jgi:hypothetical protein